MARCLFISISQQLHAIWPLLCDLLLAFSLSFLLSFSSDFLVRLSCFCFIVTTPLSLHSEDEDGGSIWRRQRG